MNIYGKALKVLEGRGWCQGAYSKPESSQVCLVGALFLAGRGYFYYRSDAQLPALHALREIEGWNEGDPEDWNDAPERTEEDVRLLLKRASVELDDNWEWE